MRDCHHRHRCRLDVRRGPRGVLGSRPPRRERHAGDHRVRREHLSLSGRRRRAAGHDRRADAAALDGARTATASRQRPRRSEALLARGALRRDCGARSVERRAAAFGEPNAGVSSAPAAAASTSASGSTRTSSPAAASTSRRTRSPIGICGMVSSEISISLGLHGISHVLSTGCTSSTDAIGYAAMLLRSGEVDVLLSGGTDGCVLPGMIFGFSRMRAVSTHYNDRPETRVAAVRSRARRLRARRGRVDAGARARSIARARAARASTRPSTATPPPATRITACRWIPTASRSCAA